MSQTLTSGFVKRKFNLMYIGALLGWFVYTLGGFVDAILAGLYISEDAVSATALVTPIYGIIFAISVLFGMGFSTKYSATVGAFEVEKSHKIAGMAVTVGAILSILCYICFIAIKGPVFSYFGVDPAVAKLAFQYYDSIALITLIYPIYEIFYYLAIEDGDSFIILSADMISAIGNPILSVIFINLWGIRGLAYGTIVTTLAGMLCVLTHYFKKRCSVKFRFGFFDLKTLIIAAKCGSTAFFTEMYVAVVDIVLNKFIIENIGYKLLPAYTVVNLITNLGVLSCCAIDSAGPFVNVAYGEKNPYGIRKIMRLALKYNLVINTILIAIFLLASGFIPDLYGIETPEIREAAVYAVRVLAFAFIFDSLIFIWINYFPKIGKYLLGNIVSLLQMLILPLFCAITFGTAAGFKGLVWGFFLTSVLTFVIVSAYIIIKYSFDRYPFLTAEPGDLAIFTHELCLCAEEISELNRIVESELKSTDVAPDIINKVELMIEETFNIIIEKNSGKRILADCTIMVDNSEVTLVTRDNGIIFDITKADSNISSIGQYVAARLMEDNKENIYLTSISFNRNCYRWDKK